MILRRSGFALLGLMLVAPALWGAMRHVRHAEAFDLVSRAATAHRHVSFTGRAAWRTTRWGRSVGITHDARSGRTRYQWGTRRSYVLSRPSSRTPCPAAWCRDLDALKESYRAEERAPTRYLGRAARRLVLTPRNPGRPTLQLIVDARTSLPLKVTTLRPDGSLYRVSTFRELEISPQDVEASPRKRRPSWAGTAVDPNAAAAEAGFALLWPDYLPAGFRHVGTRITGSVVHKVRSEFTDGATVFQLEQSRVATPAEIETEYALRYGASRVAFGMHRWRWRRLRAIARSDTTGDGTLCRRYRTSTHRIYDLRVGAVDVQLTARGDLENEETLKVLRSLRAR